MVKRPNFKNLKTRNRYIVDQHKAGVSSAWITGEVGISHSQVNRIISSFNQNGRLNRKKGSGRQTVLTKAQKLRLCKAVENHPEMSAAALAAECNIECSP